jgi:hypothetical protein
MLTRTSSNRRHQVSAHCADRSQSADRPLCQQPGRQASSRAGRPAGQQVSGQATHVSGQAMHVSGQAMHVSGQAMHVSLA